MKITVPGRAVPAVRMTRKSMYKNKQAQRYLAYKHKIGWTYKASVNRCLAGDVDVKADIFLSGGNKGDIDNYGKSILDGLNKVAYDDDRQVKRLRLEKHECSKDDERVEIELEEA